MSYIAFIITKSGTKYTVNNHGFLIQNAKYAKIFDTLEDGEKTLSKWSKIYKCYLLDEAGELHEVL